MASRLFKPLLGSPTRSREKSDGPAKQYEFTPIIPSKTTLADITNRSLSSTENDDSFATITAPRRLPRSARSGPNGTATTIPSKPANKENPPKIRPTTKVADKVNQYEKLNLNLNSSFSMDQSHSLDNFSSINHAAQQPETSALSGDDSARLGGGPLGFGRHHTLAEGSNPLREQESKIDKLEKQNLGLKVKLYYLMQQLERSTPESYQEALKENAELKADKARINAELNQARKTAQDAMEAAEAAEAAREELKQRVSEEQPVNESVNNANAEELEELQNENQNLAFELRRAENTAEELRDELEKVQSELRSKTVELEELQHNDTTNKHETSIHNSEDLQELQKLREELQQTRDQLEKYRDECEDLQVEIRQREIELEDRSTELSRIKQEMHDLRQRVTQQENHSNEADEVLQEAQQHLRQQQEELANQEAEFRRETRKLEQQLAETERKLADSERKRAELRSETEARLTRLRTELEAEAAERETALTHEAERKALEASQQAARVQALQREVESLQQGPQSSAYLTGELQRLTSECNRLQLLVDQKEDALLRKSQEAASAVAALAREQSRMAEKEAQLEAQREAQRKSKAEATEEAQRWAEEAEKQLEETRKELEELREEQRKETREAQRQETQIAELKAELAQKKTELAEAQRESARYQWEAEKAAERATEPQRETRETRESVNLKSVASNSAQIDVFRREIDSLTASVDALQTENNQLSIKQLELQKELLASHRTVNELKAETRRLQLENSQLEAELREPRHPRDGKDSRDRAETEELVRQLRKCKHQLREWQAEREDMTVLKRQNEQLQRECAHLTRSLRNSDGREAARLRERLTEVEQTFRGHLGAMAVHNGFLKGRMELELGYNHDLRFLQGFLRLQLAAHRAFTEADLRMIETVGVYPEYDRVLANRRAGLLRGRARLRIIILGVLAAVRLRRRYEQWAAVNERYAQVQYLVARHERKKLQY